MDAGPWHVRLVLRQLDPRSHSPMWRCRWVAWKSPAANDLAMERKKAARSKEGVGRFFYSLRDWQPFG